MTVVDTALHDSLRTLKLSGMLRHPRRPPRPGPRRRTRATWTSCKSSATTRSPAATPSPCTRRLRRARFDQPATLEEFDFAASPKLPAAADPRPRRPALAAQPASRSSSTARSASARPTSPKPSGHLAIRQGADVRFAKTSRALADLAGGHADRTWHRRLAELARPAVLILDDFAMRELTAAQADDLYELISERAQAGRSLIITSNRSPARLVPAVPQPRRRRVAARPAHQHQPPGLHERPQLPTQQAPQERDSTTTKTDQSRTWT